jgi:hypothetical protein
MSKMSVRCKSIFERGRFFIETGTAKTFQLFYDNSDGIIRYVPEFMIRRIADLIDHNDKDSAVTLWMRACLNADRAPMVMKMKLIHYTINIVIALMAIYAFFKVLSF